METGMTWGALPVGLTNPSKFGVQATDYRDTIWRPSFHLMPPEQVAMQKPQNDAALWSLLTMLPVKPAQVQATNPVFRWRVDNRLKQYATLTVAMAANDTYIGVDQPLMIKAGYTIILPQSDQVLYVVAVDPTRANSWTNGAGGAANVQVSRTNMPGPSNTAAIGDKVVVELPGMGEQGEPKEGITTVPGDEMFNYVQLSGVWCSITQQQMNSLMVGDWGTHAKLVQDNEARVNQMIQASILHGRKNTYDGGADEGRVFLTDGLIRQVRDNVLDAGNFGNTLVFDTISNFWDGLFESNNSSASKTHVCGEAQFMDFAGVARQAGMVSEEINYDVKLGVDQFAVRTGGGRIVNVQKMRYAFEATPDWGLTLDLGQLSLLEYAGFGWKWFTDLEVPIRKITTRKDALVGSLGVAIVDGDTCGLIRGGVNRTVTRNTLGPEEV